MQENFKDGQQKSLNIEFTLVWKADRRKATVWMLSPFRFFEVPWAVAHLCPWNTPGKNIEVACHSLLQGIFPTQGWNPGLLYYGRGL